MLSNKEIVCPVNLLNVAHKKKGVKAGIVNAGKPLPMLSVQDAVNENLIEPIFIGDKKYNTLHFNFKSSDKNSIACDDGFTSLSKWTHISYQRRRTVLASLAFASVQSIGLR